MSLRFPLFQTHSKQKILGDWIHYLAFINYNGRLVDEIFYNDLDLTKEKKEMFFMKISLYNRLQSDFEEEIGKVKLNVSELDDSKYVTIPTSSGIFLAMMNKEIDHNLFARKIIRILNYSDSKNKERFEMVVL